MSGESVQRRELHASLDPLPPATTTWSDRAVADAALSGAPLPPYRPGLYAAGTDWEPRAAAVTAWGAPLESATEPSPAETAAPAPIEEPAAEPWAAAEPTASPDASPWDAAQGAVPDRSAFGEPEAPPAEPVGMEPESWMDETATADAVPLEEVDEDADGVWAEAIPVGNTEEEQPEEVILLDDAIIEPAGDVAPDVEIAADQAQFADVSSVPLAWDADETGTEDDTIPPAELPYSIIETEPSDRSLEIETGPDRSWWADEPEPHEWMDDAATTETQPAEADWIPETETAFEEPVPEQPFDAEPTVAESAAAEVEEQPAAHVEPVAAAFESVAEPGLEPDRAEADLTPADDAVAAPAEPAAAVTGEEFPWDVEPPVIDTERQLPAGIEPDEVVSETRPAAEAPEVAEAPQPEPVTATQPVAGDEEAAERVRVLEPTPLDDWYHGKPGDEAAATWEAFGRALEEAASWGDLAAAIATGQPAGEHRTTTTASEPQGAEPAAESDQALLDLAGRLEALALRIRNEGEHAMERAMEEGDRLDVSLAGFIAGYVAARRR